MNRSPYTVTQNIETVRDGATIYGVYIHNLESLRSGDFAYDPPQEQMVDAYLAACLEYPQPPGTLTEAQTKLWDVPVQVTIGAFGGDRLDIYDAGRHFEVPCNGIVGYRKQQAAFSYPATTLLVAGYSRRLSCNL